MPTAQQRPIRLATVLRLPSPYRDPLFHKIAQIEGVEFRAFFEFKSRKGTAWGTRSTGIDGQYYFEHCYFQNSPPESSFGRFLSGVKEVFWTIRELNRFAPDLVVIYGYYFPATWGAIIWAWLFNGKYAFRSDSNYYIDNKTGLFPWIKKLGLKILVSKAQSILYIGSSSRKYWEKYGATPRQLIEARYAVNNEVFFPDETAVKCLHDGPLRFLFVGRLIERKNAILLLKAWSMLTPSERAQVELTIVGSGPLAATVELELGERQLKSVRFIGQVSPSEMPGFYRAQDVLICPYEREPWGLTINEAMCSGLAIIAATNGTCGAALDIVQHQQNGFCLESISVESLVKAIRFMITNRSFIPTMKEKSLEIIANWTYDSSISGFHEAASRAYSE